jgi:hypothetical protein
MPRCAWGIADLAIGVVLVNKVLHNRSALKDTLRTIENGGDPAVGVDLKEPSFETLISILLCSAERKPVLFLLTVRADIDSFKLIR